ncbi:hypothetical protein HDU87_001362 [Geranomyces variabilis]|uniref:Tyrosine specific protein phosphatases domain-containing protein n=1 Tax=Geranomyces variabilis TaxID=109894 RepID=A0AAD5TMR8_9FUNG|nr:hypothetical protein HDU87_001362 [Geranomyces variabilis]
MSSPEPPHSRCNFLTDDRLLLVGARPIDSTLQGILAWGASLFVNLESPAQDPDCYDYAAKLPESVELLKLPTRNGLAPAAQPARQAVKQITAVRKAGRKVYIHCNGGHGRAGTLAALVLGTLQGLDAVNAIREVERRRETRPDCSRNLVPTPESNAQVKFLAKELGVRAGGTLPDRSDKSWLKQVRADRKKRKRDSDESITPALVRTKSSLSSGTQQPIEFYTGDSKYGEFSNFYEPKTPITWNGHKYATTEHAFQAAKFSAPGASPASLEYASLIRQTSTPNKARVLALQKTGGGYAWRTALNESIVKYRDLGVVIRPGWDTVRDSVMRQLLMCKFSQDARCKQLLLATGDRPLVEHTKRDAYWGDGGDGSGRNMLGVMLMETRARLRKES